MENDGTANTVPPGVRFKPTSCELFSSYYYDRVTEGFCQWKGVILEGVNIMNFQPHNLPGMDPETREAYYFYLREKKSSAVGAKRNNRVIQGTTAFWRVSTKPETIEEELGPGKRIIWGTKTTLNHYSAPKIKTDWLMKEYVLDPSLVKPGEDLVLCKVYKKKGKDDYAGYSNEIPDFFFKESSDFGRSLKRRRVIGNPSMEESNSVETSCTESAPTTDSEIAVYTEGDLIGMLDFSTEVDVDRQVICTESALTEHSVESQQLIEEEEVNVDEILGLIDAEQIVGPDTDVEWEQYHLSIPSPPPHDKSAQGSL